MISCFASRSRRVFIYFVASKPNAIMACLISVLDMNHFQGLPRAVILYHDNNRTLINCQVSWCVPVAVEVKSIVEPEFTP